MAATNDHEKSKEISKPPKEEEEKEINLWSELPLELVGKISEHASASDPGAIATMLATCKSWNMINIRYPLPPPSNLIEHHLYPYLLTLEDSTCKFVHPIYDHIFSLETPELSGAFIRSSRFGWLLLTGRNKNPFFFNPFTRQKIDLPEVTYSDQNGLENRPPQCTLAMYFSAPPTCVDCYVIGMNSLFVFILRPGSEYWESYLFDMEENWKWHRIYPKHFKEYGLLYWVSNCHPIIHEEKGYFLGWDGCLIVFDFKTNEFSSIGGCMEFDFETEEFSSIGGSTEFDFETEEFSSIGGSFLSKEEVNSVYRSFLMKNGDELIAVFEFNREEYIRIGRLELSKEEKHWQPLANLDNQMLYVSLGTSFLMEASARAAGNKIYFPTMRGNEFIFFSLATRKYHSYSNTYSSKFPLGIKEFKASVWFELLPCNE